MTADPTVRIIAVLERLEEHWKRLRLPIAEDLRPGLSGGAVDELSARMGLALPPDLHALYGWHDGVKTPTRSRLYGPFIFRPLGDAMRATRGGRVLANAIAQEQGGDPQRYWHDDWAQVISTPSSRCLVVDANRGRRAPARIAGGKTSEGNGERVADSVTTVLEWWADVYDQDGVAVEASGQRLVRTLADQALTSEARASGVV